MLLSFLVIIYLAYLLALLWRWRDRPEVPLAANCATLNRRRIKAKSPVAAGPLANVWRDDQTIAKVWPTAQQGSCSLWARTQVSSGQSSAEYSLALERLAKTRNITRAILFGDRSVLGPQSFSR